MSVDILEHDPAAGAVQRGGEDLGQGMLGLRLQLSHYSTEDISYRVRRLGSAAGSPRCEP